LSSQAAWLEFANLAASMASELQLNWCISLNQHPNGVMVLNLR
jgi:hypothetical protein